MLCTRLYSFCRTEHDILDERVELFCLKIQSLGRFDKTRVRLTQVDLLTIRDYVRINFIMGEPL